MWGLMRLSYVNRTDATLYNIVLRLHANDVEPNCMAIASVAVNGQSALHTLSQDGSILNISLPMELKAGESAKSNPAHACGVHVHVDGAGHTARSLLNLTNIMASHEQLLIGAIGVDSERISAWCRTVDVNS